MRYRLALLRATVALMMLTLGACASVTPTTDAGLGGAIKAEATLGLSVAPMGEKVLAYATLSSPSATAATARQIATGFDPSTPDLLPLILDEIGQNMGWNGTDGIDTKRAFKAMVLADSGPLKVELVTLIPIKDPETFKRQIQTSKQETAGNDFAYESFSSPTGAHYVNFIDDGLAKASVAVMTMKPETFSAAREAIDTLNAAKSKGADILVGVEADHILKAFGGPIKAQLGQMRQMVEMASSMNPGAGGQMSTQGVEMVFEMMDRFVEDSQRAEMTIRLTPELISIEGLIELKEGSPFQKSILDQPLGDLSPLKILPKQTGIVMVGSMNLESKENTLSEFSRMAMSSLFPSTVRDNAEFSGLVDQLFGNMGTKMGMVAEVDAGFPMEQSVTTFEVVDGKAYMDSFRAFSALYDQPEVQSKMLKDFGMKISFEPGAYTMGDTPVDRTRITFDFSQMDPGTAAMMNMLGMKTDRITDLACKDTVCFQVQDPKDPKPMLETLIGGQLEETADIAPELMVVSKRAIEKPFFLFYLSYDALRSMVDKMQLPMGNPLVIFAEGQGMDFSIGGDANHFQARFNLPIATQTGAK